MLPISNEIDGAYCFAVVGPFVHPFVTLFCACHILRTDARVLIFYIWISHEKIDDPYFFFCPTYLYFQSYAL